ncbi:MULTISPECIES: PAS domain-containing hybrid sensor histidine kinase/response regulator [Pseudanabaena]|uniref:PAS domain-containing hybrid sensor histidine kinase/response regulator n=1 Tax=Pseudanabaena TaxID=1152 RepID=UPI0024787B2B|nr:MULTISPECIES: PAS domain-containing hybrid sensor histidine kinase/response regulator [Pseudanabaena]MEA5485523.1 ATP-binding protein [Pseudanabaena sp. CCNP1317]WGS70662.1 ATP-binding protein [Pseudanabaena galeata CCNP1313]
MDNPKVSEEISIKDWQMIQQEVKELRRSVSQLQMENCDLENSLLTAVEHGDLVESELLDVNKRLKSEIIERKMAQATLQSILEIVYRDKSDLEIMLMTTTEHGDAIEYEQYNRAVETMRQSEEQFRAIAESTSMAMLVSSLSDGTITYANTSAGTMLQRESNELIKRSIKDLYYLPSEWEILQQQFLQNQRVRDYEIRLCKANQEPLWVLASLHSLWLKGEQVLLNTFYDITLLKRTEIALRDSETKLREQANLLEHRVEERTHDLKLAKDAAETASRSKAAFLANMSHELRTPLNAILGFAQLMLYDQELNEQHQADLQTICNSGNHLLTMINDILEMSKLEAGSVLLREKECYLYNIVDTARDMLSLKAQEKSLSFDVSIQPDVPPYIYTDEGKLRQILINLISNAIKFTDTGHIHVRVDVRSLSEDVKSIAGEYSEIPRILCFEVEDTGAGISEAEISTLFQPFVQTHSGRRSQEGTGLGLSISYNYVKIMGGQMSVTSKVGEGSTFRFYIPVRSLDLFSLNSPNKLLNRVIGIEGNQTYRILIAEDIRLNRQLLTRILSPLGFEVREVSNGEEAIAVWQSWSPHLIWMDVRMPILGGQEAASAIRELESMRNISASQKVQIIALTASLIDIREEDLFLHGFDGFLSKPFTEDKIFDRMAEHLNLTYIYRQ